VSPFTIAPNAKSRTVALAGTPSGRLKAPVQAGVTGSMAALQYLIDTIIWLYIIALIVMALASWLVAFDVINRRNPFVASLLNGLYQITEPALRPIRNFLPSFGGLDISPVILIVLLQALRILVGEIFSALQPGSIRGI
jgi:YggT family protein